jgi:hypothetical protein
MVESRKRYLAEGADEMAETKQAPHVAGGVDAIIALSEGVAGMGRVLDAMAGMESQRPNLVCSLMGESTAGVIATKVMGGETGPMPAATVPRISSVKLVPL